VKWHGILVSKRKVSTRLKDKFPCQGFTPSPSLVSSCNISVSCLRECCFSVFNKCSRKRSCSLPKPSQFMFSTKPMLLNQASVVSPFPQSHSCWGRGCCSDVSRVMSRISCRCRTCKQGAGEATSVSIVIMRRSLQWSSAHSPFAAQLLTDVCMTDHIGAGHHQSSTSHARADGFCQSLLNSRIRS